MKKKKLKKKYELLQKRYDSLWCDYVRLKEPRLSNFTDAQIIHCKETITNLGESLVKAFNNLNSKL